MLILEVNGQGLLGDSLDQLLSKFRVSLVEETAPNDDITKLLLQFEDLKEIEKFNHERELWSQNSEQVGCLTKIQRNNLFSSISSIRALGPEDRKGERLKQFLSQNPPEKLLFLSDFIVDIDVWYNDDKREIINLETQIKQTLGSSGQLLGDLFEIPGLLLGKARVNQFSLNALLDMDIISQVDLPFESIPTESRTIYSDKFEPLINISLDQSSPLAGVIDSGVSRVNPLLQKGAIHSEDNFDSSENTLTDLNGHGTATAGIVVYGGFPDITTPSLECTARVRICSAKIMHDKSGNTAFPQNKRPEQLTKEAIEYLYTKYKCRIFNLSVGDSDHVYNGGRQFAWANMLDEISRQLDVVIVVSAGNVSDPDYNLGCTREEILKNARDNLFQPCHKLIDPATSALSITVGSITRRSDPEVKPHKIVSVSVGNPDSPSVFTRVGLGVRNAIKPEFVDYGGNFALSQRTRGHNVWRKNDANLAEPSLSIRLDRIFEGFTGTSMAAPHVTHIAARIEHSLKEQLGNPPSANLIRAVLCNSAVCTEEMEQWAYASGLKLGKSKDPKQERKLRLYGYGKVSEDLLHSSDRTVTLFAEDELSLRDLHLYKIPVPKIFLSAKANKSIRISLAYNPVTHSSRREYLANNLWFEVFRRIDEEDLLRYKAKKEKGMTETEELDSFPDSNKAAFLPGYKALMHSTLQQRVWSASARGGQNLMFKNSDQDSYIYVLVTGRERFKYQEMHEPQPYALCITFTHDSEKRIRLYDLIRNQVRLKAREKIRERVFVK